MTPQFTIFFDFASCSLELGKNSLKNSPELRFAGYIVEAEKELVEASLVYEYELNGEILPYKAMRV